MRPVEQEKVPGERVSGYCLVIDQPIKSGKFPKELQLILSRAGSKNTIGQTPNKPAYSHTTILQLLLRCRESLPEQNQSFFRIKPTPEARYVITQDGLYDNKVGNLINNATPAQFISKN